MTKRYIPVAHQVNRGEANKREQNVGEHNIFLAGVEAGFGVASPPKLTSPQKLWNDAHRVHCFVGEAR